MMGNIGKKLKNHCSNLSISAEQIVENGLPHFNVEITPPQTSEPEGATCLPDVVPKPLALKHRPSLSAQMSSSLDTDSSLAETSPLFQVG